ncbi:MAG TPA: YbjN domain-containing protein [Nitrospira sp.]|nr:YbjN domain-containing protein [Nitrospira sp.]
MDWDVPTPGNMMEVITRYFEQENINYRRIDGKVLHAGFQGRHLNYQVLVMVHEEKRRAVFHSTVPVRVQQEQRAVVAEYICRANQGLMLGKFELDFESGSVTYKTSIDVDGGELTMEMVRTLLHVNLSTTDRYATGLIRVLYGDLRPAQAIAELEGHSAMRRRAAQAALN